MANGDTSSDRVDERQPSLVAQPLAWLSVAIAGFVFACAGIAIEAYRHNHGADAGELISASNPGVLVAVGGLGIAAIGTLAAASVVALRGVRSADEVMRRGVAVTAAWVVVGAAAAGALTYVATTGITLGHTGHGADQPATDSTAAGNNGQASIPGSDERITLSGNVTFDGAPLVAPFLGARMIRDGVGGAACQLDLVSVEDGRYQLTIMADAEARGCGAREAEILLWTTVDDRYLWTRETLPWPGPGGRVTFDWTFSSSDPDGASQPATELFGTVSGRDGTLLPRGTVVEAYIGDTRCGVASVRYTGYEGFSLGVAGPHVPGCARDATVTFRIDGQPAAQTTTNDLARGRDARELDLTLK